MRHIIWNVSILSEVCLSTLVKMSRLRSMQVDGCSVVASGKPCCFLRHSKHTPPLGLLRLISDISSYIYAAHNYLLPSPQWRLWTDAFLSYVFCFFFDSVTTPKCSCWEITHCQCRQNIVVLPSLLEKQL